MEGLVIVGIPCLVLILSLAWRYATGPFWLGSNIDGAYQYLINSLYLADHQVPLYVQHPGTPVQMMGAVVIKLLNGNVPAQQMVVNVLRAPEFYMHVMYAVLILFYALTLVALAFCAYKRSGSLTLAILVQSSAFLYLTMCKENGFTPVLANMCTETLLPGLMNLYGICFLTSFFSKEKEALWTALGWGAVYGVMLASKLTCFSLMILPLVLLPALRDKFLFFLVSIVSFVLSTGPIWSRYPAMWGNIYGMMTHTEFQGNGAQGFIAWKSFFHGLVQTFTQEWLLATSALVVTGIILYGLWVNKKLNKAYTWAAWVAATIILHFLMVAKEPADHYMVCVVGLFGFLWTLMYQGGLFSPRIWRGVIIFFTAVSLILNFIYMKKFYASSQLMQDFSKAAYGHEGIICGYYRSSSVPFALSFGDDAFGLQIYGNLIAQLYPKSYTMDITHLKIDDPPGAFLEDVLASGHPVFLYGSNLPESVFSPMFKVKAVAQSGKEEVYQVLEANDRKAFVLYGLAGMALMHGQGQAAYLFALKARDLGLPQARDLVARMDAMMAKGVAGSLSL